jgi:hypothetical protein
MAYVPICSSIAVPHFGQIFGCSFIAFPKEVGAEELCDCHGRFAAPLGAFGQGLRSISKLARALLLSEGQDDLQPSVGFLLPPREAVLVL